MFILIAHDCLVIFKYTCHTNCHIYVDCCQIIDIFVKVVF